ncbi:MAG: hypothetical protein FWC66_04800 [Oscillospiraceae bacterium]|nr:hypothetical protein [Oscillospiraceae bacterium]
MIRKKKKTVKILISIVLMFILGACSALSVAGQNSYQKGEDDMDNVYRLGLDYQPIDRDVIVYAINKEPFQAFLKNPSLDALAKKSNAFLVFNKFEFWEGYIHRQTFLRDGRIFDDEMPSGFFRIGRWPVYTEFIDFMNDHEYFERLLCEHGTEGEILSVIIIEHPDRMFELWDDGLPMGGVGSTMCIWIHTDSGDYFLAFNSSLSEFPGDTTFRYDFHDLASFSQMQGR